MGIKEKVFDSLKWLTLARLIAQLARWGSTLLVIRLLAPSDLGIAALAQTVLSLLELFTSFGLGAAIVQSKTINTRKLKVIFGMIIAINLCLASILWGIAPTLADFYDRPELVQVLRVLATTFLLIIIGSIPAHLLVREMRFKVIALGQVLSGFAGAGVSLYLAYNGYGYWALIYGGIAIMATTTLVQFLARPIFVIPVFNFIEAKQFLTFGSLVMASIIARYLYVNLDVMIAGKSWTAQTLGIYAVAIQLAVLPLNKMMPMIRQVAFPAYSRNQTDQNKVKSYMTKSMNLAMALSFPIFFGISSVAALIVPLALGDSWQEAVLPIMMLCIIIPFRMMVELYEPAINAIGRPKIVFLNSMFILAVMTPTFYVFMQWGVVGLSLGWLLIFPVLAMSSSYWYCHVIELSFFSMIQAIKGPFIASSLMWVAVYMFIHSLMNSVNQLMLLILAVALGALIYVALIFVLDRQILNQYKEILVSRRVSAS